MKNLRSIVVVGNHEKWYWGLRERFAIEICVKCYVIYGVMFITRNKRSQSLIETELYYILIRMTIITEKLRQTITRRRNITNNQRIFRVNCYLINMQITAWRIGRLARVNIRCRREREWTANARAKRELLCQIVGTLYFIIAPFPTSTWSIYRRCIISPYHMNR